MVHRGSSGGQNGVRGGVISLRGDGSPTVDIEYNDTNIRYKILGHIGRAQIYEDQLGNFKGHWITAIVLGYGQGYGYLNGSLVTSPSTNLG